MGTIRRHIQEIAPLTPECIICQPVQGSVGGAEADGGVQFRVNHPPGKVFFPDFSGPAGHPHIPEAEIREVGPNRFPAAVRHINHLRLRGAVVVVVEVSSLQDLTVVQDNPRSGREISDVFRVSGEVLPEIQHRFPGGGPDHFLYRQAVHYGHRQAVTVCQGTVRHQHSSPVRVFLPVPQRPVQRFAVVDICSSKVASPVLPDLIRRNNLLRSVRQPDPQLRQDLEPVSEHFPRAFITQPSLVPAVSGINFDPVLPGADQVADIISLNLDRFVIIVAERRQQIIAGLFAVHIRLVQPQPAHIQPGGHRFRRYLEIPEENRMETIFLPGADPFSGPGLPHLAGFKKGISHSRVACIPFHPDPAVIAGPRCQFHGDFQAERLQ